MLMRTDPFRDLDRLTQQVLGTAARPAVMLMDAWREGEAFVVEFDLPGVRADTLELDVERNTLTVHAERAPRDPNKEMVAAERPTGVFSRQLFLGDNLDTEKIDAHYEDGVLRLTIPVAEKAKPRKEAESKMSTTDTAPDRPGTADSDLEWDCLEWEEELLIAEIEEFLATIPTPRSTRTRTTELTTAGRRPAHDADAETVPPPARRAPARHSGATQRSPPLQQ